MVKAKELNADEVISFAEVCGAVDRIIYGCFHHRWS